MLGVIEGSGGSDLWFGIICLVVVTTIVLMAKAKGGVTEKAGAVKGWFGKLITQTSNYQSWLQSIKVIVALALGLILVGIFWPALWQWLQSQKIFWLAVIVLPLLAAGAVKYKWLRPLAVVATVIGLLAADWSDFPSNPTDWRLSAEEVKKAAEQRETTRAALAARGVTSIGPRIISAKPDSFDEEVTISGQKGMDFHSEGCIEFRVTITNFGKSRVIEPKPRYCPGEETPHIKYPPLGQATLAPRSLTGSEVRVFFWEPK